MILVPLLLPCRMAKFAVSVEVTGVGTMAVVATVSGTMTVSVIAAVNADDTVTAAVTVLAKCRVQYPALTWG